MTTVEALARDLKRQEEWLENHPITKAARLIERLKKKLRRS
jgi:hypothetical protein